MPSRFLLAASLVLLSQTPVVAADDAADDCKKHGGGVCHHVVGTAETALVLPTFVPLAIDMLGIKHESDKAARRNALLEKAKYEESRLNYSAAAEARRSAVKLYKHSSTMETLADDLLAMHNEDASIRAYKETLRQAEREARSTKTQNLPVIKMRIQLKLAKLYREREMHAKAIKALRAAAAMKVCEEDNSAIREVAQAGLASPTYGEKYRAILSLTE